MNPPRISLSDKEWFIKYVKYEPWIPMQNHGYFSDEYNIDHPFKYHLVSYEKLIEGHDLRGKRIIELGSGFGTGLNYLNNKYNLDILGIDNQPEFVQFARKNFKDRFMLEDFIKPLNLKSESADVVLMSDSYHTMYDYKKFYIHLNDLLPEDGILIMSDFFIKNSIHQTKKIFENYGFEMISQQNITENVIKSMEYDIDSLQDMFKNVSKEALTSYIRIQKHRHYIFKIQQEQQYILCFQKKILKSQKNQSIKI
tara:strand:- start:75 stop:836 length:762 start_codon:yes stop_codon:yes gene_type:complete